MSEFWKVENIPFWEGRVLRNSPQKLQEFPPHSFSHLSWFEVLPCQGSEISSTFSWGPIRMTNYNVHAHVQYCIGIHYLGCSIDKYRNVKYVKCSQFWKVRNIPFGEGRVLKNSRQKLQEFPPHSFSQNELIWGSHMLGVSDIIYLLGDLSEW